MLSPGTPADFAELERLFHEALELPPGTRAAFVERLREHAPPLAERLAELLAADDGDHDTIGTVIASAVRSTVANEDRFVGERFGPYRVERLIGRGGMGAVYLGRREDGAFAQDVAIKTIIAGLASPSTLARFRREREILARLNHQSIARLFDGGEGPHGVPFVVMELVEGVPITQYVGDCRAGLRRRLELFRELCDAVEFVHGHLVVHRDIKPGNVLVAADGHVKLLDFGVAKLTEELEAQSGATVAGYPAMTPEYASPEQILGEPVTTATDIYSLGVLLFELVTGELPISGVAGSPLERARHVVAGAPALPSEIAAGRSADAVDREPARFARQLRGDLDHIVLTALRKEPGRRYASVAAFSADVDAWMNGRPVAARADTWRYRLRKLVGRHPVASAATSVAVAAALGFTALTLWQNRVIERERDRAVLSARRATATADFLVSLFAAADPRQAGSRNMTAFELLKAGVADLRANTTLDPDVRADLYLTLGLSLSNLEAFDEGIDSLRASLAVSERTHGRDSLEAAERLQRLGDVLRRVKRFDESLADLTEALDIRRRRLRGESYEIADSYNNLAILAADMGDPIKAERLQTASVAMHTRLASDRGVPLNNLALLRRRQGRYREAMVLAAQAFEMLSRTSDRDSAWRARINVATIRREMGEVEEALRILESVRRLAVADLGADHSRIISIDLEIARCRLAKGESERVARMYDEIEHRISRALGSRSALVARVLRDRGLLLRSQGRSTAAIPLLEEALSREVEAEGPRHFRVPSFRRALADTLADTGRLAEAERLLRGSVALLPDPAVYPHLELARTLTSLARTLRLGGRRDEARTALAEAEDLIRRTAGEDSLEMGSAAAEGRLIDPEGRPGRGPGPQAS
jgi:serine/threonine protein kinase/tetratricopeptide (TPR) repeat protein